MSSVVAEWVRHLREELYFGPDDPLFPATKIALNDEGHFAVAGLERRHWANADPIRRIFRESFKAAGLPYYNPHSFRSTLARLGQQTCRNAEELKAWSQNLGHEQVMTTLTSYGTVPSYRQAELITAFRDRAALAGVGIGTEEIARAVRLLNAVSPDC